MGLLRSAPAGLAGMAQIPKRLFLLSLISQGRRDVPERNVFLSQRNLSYYHRIRPGAGLKKSFSKGILSFKGIFISQLKESTSPGLLKEWEYFYKPSCIGKVLL